MFIEKFIDAFKGLGVYQQGIQAFGEKKTPIWLKSSCLGLLSIPIIGGLSAIIDSLFISGGGKEHIPMFCGATLGLLAIGIGTAIKNTLKKK